MCQGFPQSYLIRKWSSRFIILNPWHTLCLVFKPSSYLSFSDQINTFLPGTTYLKNCPNLFKIMDVIFFRKPFFTSAKRRSAPTPTSLQRLTLTKRILRKSGLVKHHKIVNIHLSGQAQKRGLLNRKFLSSKETPAAITG